MKRNIVVNPKFEALRPYVQSIAEGNADLGTEIYRARNVVTETVQSGHSLVIKSFKRPKLPNSFVYAHLRHSKARRSYEYSMRLISMGVGTAEPVAYIEITSGGVLRESFYISLKVDAQDMRFWEKRPDSEQLLHKFAAFMLDLRNKGVLHKDFSPGNILVDNDYRFYLLDVNRMQFGVTDHERFIANFARLHTVEREVARLALIYAKLDGNAAPDAFAQQAVAQFRAFWDGKRRKNKIKQLLRGSK